MNRFIAQHSVCIIQCYDKYNIFKLVYIRKQSNKKGFHLFVYFDLFILFLVVFGLQMQKQPTERDNINKNEIANGPNSIDKKETDDIFRFKIFGLDVVKEWNYPNTDYCPIGNCQQKFESRELAIGHYREYHAKFIVWCKICNRGISTKSHDRFHKHYQIAHPDQQWPADWRKYLVRQHMRSSHFVFWLFLFWSF